MTMLANKEALRVKKAYTPETYYQIKRFTMITLASIRLKKDLYM